jgi:hypothetical protein
LMLVWLMSPMRCGVVVPSSVRKCVQRLVTASSEGPWLAESCGDVETCGDVKTDDGRRVEGGVPAESCGDVKTDDGRRVEGGMPAKSFGDVKTDDGRRVEGGVSAVVEALGEHGVEEHASCAP